jgi:CRISPR/Cas system CSM-associated protein Csm3 (group 7 of RAMP superfamily)
MSSKPRPVSGPPPRGGENRRPAPPGERRPPYDFYVAYPCETQDDVRRIVGDHKEPYRELVWPHARVSLLAQGLTSDVKEFARSGHPRFGGGYKGLVFRRKGDSPYVEGVISPGLEQLARLGIYPPRIDLQDLPPFSACIQFRFTLARPVYSRDDEEFYIHENPGMKDAVWKVPMMRASTWKGILRTVLSRQLPEGEASPLIARLFGQARGEEEELAEEGNIQGRFRCYPTFFDCIGLEVINPHSRKTRAGTVPILLETVPAGASGVFTLLYLPFDLMDRTEEQALPEIREDLRALGEAIVIMMRVHGFSGKSTRGFGQARLKVSGVDEPEGVVALKGVGRQTFATLAALSDALDLLLGTPA